MYTLLFISLNNYKLIEISLTRKVCTFDKKHYHAENFTSKLFNFKLNRMIDNDICFSL